MTRPITRRKLTTSAVVAAVCASAALFAAVSTGPSAFAQSPPSPRAGPRASPPNHTGAARPSAPSLLDAGSGPVDSGVVQVTELDGGNQIFKFGEIDIEGRLKTPTLVYFLRRVRAEFAAGDLGHRSFLRELSQTRNTQSF